MLEVRRYVITEHLLHVGTYHMLTAIRDEDKRQKLEEHLVKGRLLGSELHDDEDVFGPVGRKPSNAGGIYSMGKAWGAIRSLTLFNWIEREVMSGH